MVAEANAEQSRSSFKVAYLQWLAIFLGVLLYWLRTSKISILGHKIDLLCETVPMECVVWSAIMLEFAMQDITQSLGAF